MRLRTASCVRLIVLALAGGCYRLTPIEGATPDTGSEVRLSLSDEGSVRMAPLIGPRISAIDGRSMEATDTALVVAVQAVVAQGGRSMPWSMERLTVPRSAVASIRTRTLDRKKTWIVAGLGVVGALALGDAFGLGTGFGGFLGIGGDGGKR
ncbi:MAG TPA: hypothetical protein VIK50_06565 [Gemmatimonadaceae bacterium]